jgi:zinc protease
MKNLLFIAVLLLSGCTQALFSQQSRPDQLTFPPLEFHFPEVARQQLDNGMKVYLKEDHELPLVELTVMVEGGSIYDPAGKTGLSQFFASSLSTGGTQQSSPEKLEAELEAIAADLSVSSSLYGYEIDLSLNRQDLARGIEILAELLRQPRFDKKRMELVRTQMLEQIKRQNDDPGSIAGRLLKKEIYHDHPLGAYPTRSGVESFKREDLLQLHQRYFQPQNVWLAASGDVTKSEFLGLLKTQFGDWTMGETFLRQFDLPPAGSTGKVILVDKKIPQTTILLGQPGIEKDNPDVFAVQVANFILGGGGFNSRMMREIRSDRGLAYSVYSYFQIGRQLPGLFVAGSETKCGSTIEVVQLLIQLIEQICQEPVSAEELELAKNSLINSFIFAFEDSHSIVSRKLRLDYYNYPIDYLETYRQNLAAVTIADVQRVARTYLHPDQMQIVLVGDSEQYRDTITTLGCPVETVDPKSAE